MKKRGYQFFLTINEDMEMSRENGGIPPEQIIHFSPAEKPEGGKKGGGTGKKEAP